MTSKKTKKSGNLFKKCFPCFGNPHIDSEEINRRCFGDEFTEYEYVIENLAIRKAPKALLDAWEIPKKGKFKSIQTEKSSLKDQSSITTKKIVRNVIVNPVLTDSGTLREDSRIFPLMPKHGTLTPSDDSRLNPCYLHLFPNKATCPSCKKAGKLNVDKDILKKMLLPPTNISRLPTRKFQKDLSRNL